MKQQTVIQILLDAINKELESNKIKDLEYYGGLEDVRDYILDNFLLEKEKEQIMRAFNTNELEEDGEFEDGMGKMIWYQNAEQYYNSTYKQD